MLHLWFACRPPDSVLPDDPTTRWTVAVVSASGGGVVTSTTELEVTRIGPDTRSIRTVRAEGTWETTTTNGAWASDRPDPGTPWAVTLGHTIAEIPAAVVLDPDGRPAALVDPGGWSAAVEAALSGLPGARASTALVDPEGLLQDLRRVFPGVPAAGGAWVRDEPFGSTTLRREEVCARTRDGARTRWSCTGTVTGAGVTDGAAATSLELDRRGMVSLESRWDAVIHGSAAGVRRLVVREPA